MTLFKRVRPSPHSHLISLGDGEEIAGALRHGALAVLPTETGYMLAALSTSTAAVERVFAAKGRAAASVMHVACASLQMANTAGVFTPRARSVLGKLTPGPVTVVVEKTPLLPDALVTLNGTVGIRVPDHPATLQIIASVGAPLTATSLNMSGSEPARLEGFDLGLLNWPEGETVYVVEDDESIAYKAPSTLVRLIGEEPEILRAGPVSEEEIRRASRGR